MFNRLIKLPKKRSFFLFGARGTGKSTLIEGRFQGEKTHWIDLLNQDEEARYAARPQLLQSELDKEGSGCSYVVIDEVQKVPGLLDVVQLLMKRKDFTFVISGSSARKLKRGAANLLAGRAESLKLFPLTHLELGEEFNLSNAMSWGTLPEIFSLEDSEKLGFLRSYCQTYLKEEVVTEQLVRKLVPFRAFLEVAAQMAGKIINYSNIARDIDSDPVTVQNYFSILEDTLLGFSLAPFAESVRKRQRKSSKFFIFDLGVERALARQLEVTLSPKTYAFGEAFERFVITEIHRLKTYLKPDWEMFYLCTKDDAEIDLIIDRPGLPRALIEIKSTERIHPEDLRTLNQIGPDIRNSVSYCFSQDHKRQKLGSVNCLPWRGGIQEIGLFQARS